MPNVYLYLVAGIAFLVAVGAAGAKGYFLGADHVRSEYAARDIAAANEAAAQTKRLQDEYRAKEQASAVALAAVSKDYQGRLTDAQAKTRIAMDAIRAGGLRFRDPGAEARRDCPAEAAASAAGRDGAESGRLLSQDAAVFLTDLAAEADRNTIQLVACQAVVAADRR